MTSLKIVDALAHDKWVQFLERHPDANVFHTPYMLEVFSETKDYEPFVFAAINELDNNIQCLFTSTRINIFGGLLSKLSSRMISYGGIIHCPNGNNALQKLMEAYDKPFKNKTLFCEIRNMCRTESFKADMIAAGYQYKEYLNYLIDLRSEPSSIFRHFSRGRKGNIKALEKKGAYVKEVTDIKDIRKVYDILDQTYSRIQVPLADISLFESMMKHLANKGMAKFTLAKLKDKTVAALVALIFKGTITAWYYGSNPMFRKLSPESLLIWHLIRWGSLNGYQTLDFGGAGRPDEEYGVREFKSRFHGQLCNYGRYIKVYSPMLLKIAEPAYSIYRKAL